MGTPTTSQCTSAVSATTRTHNTPTREKMAKNPQIPDGHGRRSNACGDRRFRDHSTTYSGFLQQQIPTTTGTATTYTERGSLKPKLRECTNTAGLLHRATSTVSTTTTRPPIKHVSTDSDCYAAVDAPIKISAR